MEAKMLNTIRTFRRINANIIGMIHVGANPATPNYKGSIKDIIKKAEFEAKLYKEAGLDGVIVENMNDIPYTHGHHVGPEVVSVMTIVCDRVRQVFDSQPVGLQILAGANQQAMAVALATDLDFIRAEGFVFSHVADEGWMDACAGPLLRYRKQIGADQIKVITDIKKKHSAHAVTADVSVEETARAAQFFLSDGIILTGTSTGNAADVAELNAVQDSVSLPMFVGSGVTKDNFKHYKSAFGLIIGSYFKKGHHWANDLDPDIIADFMQTVRKDSKSQ